MPRYQLDLSDVESLDYPPPVAEGVYEARVDATNADIEQDEDDEGRPTAAIVGMRFVIENHPEFAGRGITKKFSLSGKGRFYTGRAAKALGLGVEAGSKNVGDTREWHGRRCRIVVKHSPDRQGRIWANVDAVLPLEDDGEDTARTTGLRRGRRA